MPSEDLRLHDEEIKSAVEFESPNQLHTQASTSGGNSTIALDDSNASSEDFGFENSRDNSENEKEPPGQITQGDKDVTYFSS